MFINSEQYMKCSARHDTFPTRLARDTSTTIVPKSYLKRAKAAMGNFVAKEDNIYRPWWC